MIDDDQIFRALVDLQWPHLVQTSFAFGELEIIVLGLKRESAETSMDISGVEMSGFALIPTTESPAFRIVFQNCLAHLITDEVVEAVTMVSMADVAFKPSRNKPGITIGRTEENTPFSRFVYDFENAALYGKATHWRIATMDQVLDVISTSDPSVTQIDVTPYLEDESSGTVH